MFKSAVIAKLLRDYAIFHFLSQQYDLSAGSGKPRKTRLSRKIYLFARHTRTSTSLFPGHFRDLSPAKTQCRYEYGNLLFKIKPSSSLSRQKIRWTYDVLVCSGKLRSLWAVFKTGKKSWRVKRKISIHNCVIERVYFCTFFQRTDFMFEYSLSEYFCFAFSANNCALNIKAETHIRDWRNEIERYSPRISSAISRWCSNSKYHHVAYGIDACGITINC